MSKKSYWWEAETFAYYRVPKALFTNPRYKALSADAALLYGLLLDRTSLSGRNAANFSDESGRIFIYYTLNEVCTAIGCGHDNEEMDALAESIKENGILTPLIVRPIENTGEYEIISGHRRLYAAQKAGLAEIPALIRVLDRDSAAIAVVDSNLHREHILPSEKAFAYKMKMKAVSHQGVPCGQVGHKSRDNISDTDSGRQVQRYIRLTYLIPEFLEKMDKGEIVWNFRISMKAANKMY